MSTPLDTGQIGLSQTGRAVTYVPPTATAIPVGSTVTYGPWIQLPAGCIGPGTYEIASGSSPLQAANSGFIRYPVITPF